MPKFVKDTAYTWNFGNSGQSPGVNYDCGYCGNKVAPVASMTGQLTMHGAPQNRYGRIYFCPMCVRPTFNDGFGDQVPAVRLGAELKNLPEDGLKQLYGEARDCSASGAYTACVMACRKILMNLAVREGAKESGSFVGYVDYLSDNNFVPPKGKAWVTKIKDKGNEANHEIKPMTAEDAKEILYLVEMLLRFNFELGTP